MNTKKTYSFICPNCGNLRVYTWKQSYWKGKNKKCCVKCKRSYQQKWKDELSPEEYKKKCEEYSTSMSDSLSKIKDTIERKSVFEWWKEKYSKEEADKKIKSFSEKVSKNNTENNPMKGKSVYSVWLEKYGKEEADRRMIEAKTKWSTSSSGENNPMYGKPSPHGTGNGWKGWYKGWYFRSLREVSYVVNTIEKNGWKWEPAENSKFYIKYKDYKGTDRTYRADFIINDKVMVEIKPKRLHMTPNVSAKKEAAERFCKEHNLEYLLIDSPIDYKTIFDLYKSGSIIMQGIYDKKIREYIEKENKNDKK